MGTEVHSIPSRGFGLPWPCSQLSSWALKANAGTAGCCNKAPCKDNNWCNDNIPALLDGWQLLLLMRFVFCKLGLGFSCHVSNSHCQMMPFLFSSFSYKADVPRRVHSSERGNPASDQLHCWLTFVQHSHFVAVMALKNVSICQHAQVQESTMALLERCWLFDGKFCCLLGE